MGAYNTVFATLARLHLEFEELCKEHGVRV
jgi:hypothetical protein